MWLAYLYFTFSDNLSWAPSHPLERCIELVLGPYLGKGVHHVRLPNF